MLPQPGGLSRIETDQGPVLVSGTEVGETPFIAVSPREITLYAAGAYWPAARRTSFAVL